MTTGNRAAGFERLACRITVWPGFARIKSMTAIDEKFDPTRTVITAKTGMVGSPFVAHMVRAGQGGMMGEMIGIGECRGKCAPGYRMFNGSVEHGAQIGRGEMHLAIACIATGRDGCGIGRPHRGCR